MTDRVPARLKFTRRMFSGLPPIGFALLLASCNSGPSATDVALAVGHAIEDVNCVQANGKPGHVCTFNLRGYSQTRRMVKRDDGGWDALYN